jgi:hypothetical protein
MDNKLSDLAVAWRELCQKASNLSVEVNGQNQAIPYLQGLGYDTSEANDAERFIAYFNTLAQIYYGQLQQGGQGGTGATTFDFHNATSVLWGGRV